MWILVLLVSILLIAADQTVKYWTVCNFAAPVAGRSVTADPAKPLLPGLVELTRAHNTGAGWSLFSGMRWVLVAVTVVLLLVVVVLAAKRIVRHPVGLWACGLIFAGGMGNLIDRVRQGYVVDMFNFQFIDFPVFNVADICVVCGAILAAIYYLWFMKYDEKKEPAHEDHPSAG